jgi:hypothetical protein
MVGNIWPWLESAREGEDYEKGRIYRHTKFYDVSDPEAPVSRASSFQRTQPRKRSAWPELSVSRRFRMAVT